MDKKETKKNKNKKPGQNIYDLDIIAEDENEGFSSDRKSVNVL